MAKHLLVVSKWCTLCKLLVGRKVTMIIDINDQPLHIEKTEIKKIYLSLFKLRMGFSYIIFLEFISTVTCHIPLNTIINMTCKNQMT